MKVFTYNYSLAQGKFFCKTNVQKSLTGFNDYYIHQPNTLFQFSNPRSWFSN